MTTALKDGTTYDMGRGTTSLSHERQITRYHADPTQHLTGYAVFHGDDRMPDGEPLPTGSLRLGDKSLRGGTTIMDEDYIPGTTQLRTNVSLTTLKAKVGIVEPSGVEETDTMGAESNKASGTIFNFATGTYASKSGLVPQHNKQWLPEYADEYRGPKERSERAQTMTMRHGTASAMKDSRYQFRGYPYSHV